MPQWPAERLDPEAYPGPGTDLRIFYNDLDTNGHLNNVAIGRFFEEARFSGPIAAGLREAHRETGSKFLVARVAIDYLREGRHGPPLHVRSRFAKVGTTSAREEQAAWQNGHCIALCEVTIVNVLDGQPTPITDSVRALFETMRP